MSAFGDDAGVVVVGPILGLKELYERAGQFAQVGRRVAKQGRSAVGDGLIAGEADTAIESATAQLAATRADEGDLMELEECLDEMRASRHDPVAYTAADLGFHIVVANAASNPFLSMLLNALAKMIVQGILESSQSSQEATVTGIRGHGRILRRLEERDAEGAVSDAQAPCRVPLTVPCRGPELEYRAPSATWTGSSSAQRDRGPREVTGYSSCSCSSSLAGKSPAPGSRQEAR